MSEDLKPYTVNANGNKINDGETGFVVNPTDPTSEAFVQSLKDGTNPLSTASGVVHSTAADVVTEPVKAGAGVVVDEKPTARTGR